ncbi:hypothetical protein BDW75DRAFT_242201 [Aspergillus navahoensis]
MISLQDKVAVITGCSSGIGLASAELFLELGAKVFGIDIQQPPQVLAENERFRHGAFNLLEAASAEGIIRETVSTFGRVDIILNIAGARDNFAGLDKVDMETWNKVMMVNVTMPALLSKHAVSEFKRQGSEGSIVNVSSKAGLSGAIAGTAYTTSKHAIIGLTKNVAWRFHNDGIRCNTICPGGFLTAGTQAIDWNAMDQDAMEVLRPVLRLHARPDGSRADPREAANLMAFLCSPAAKQINGAVIPIDNAWSTI